MSLGVSRPSARRECRETSPRSAPFLQPSGVPTLVRSTPESLSIRQNHGEMTGPSGDRSPRHGLRSRIRYHFDNLLARGTWATLLWLGAITLMVVLVSAALLAIFQVTFSGGQDTSFLEDFWQTLLRVMDPGTMASDVGWGRRILALGVTVFGILVAGTLIGVIAAGVEDRVESMRRGRSVVAESDHIVVLGDSRRLPILLYQLSLAKTVRGRGTIVVLAGRDPSELHEDVRRVSTARLGVRLVVRSGDPTRPADLEMTRLQDARTVIVLADDRGGDARAIKTVMAAGAMLGDFGDLPIIVELSDPILGQGLAQAWGANVHPIVPTQAITRTASFALRDRGLGQVLTRLTDLEGSDLHVVAEPELIGLSFGEVVSRYANARPLGRMVSNGRVELNPDPEVTFGTDDRLVVIADDARAMSPSTRSSHLSPSPPPHPSLSPGDTRAEEHLQVVGWNDLGAAMLDDWAQFAAKGSWAEVFYDPRVLGPEEINTPAGSDGPRIVLTPTTDLPVVPGSLSPDATTVLLLSYASQLRADDADSRTLLESASLRRHLGEQTGTVPRVITHLVEANNIPLSGTQALDDFVVSDAIGSQLIAQFAEQPERRPVLLEFYLPGGPEIRLIPAAKLGLTGAFQAGEIFDSVYQNGLIAIGWRLHGEEGDLVLNPHESSRVELGSDDDIVLIG